MALPAAPDTHPGGQDALFDVKAAVERLPALLQEIAAATDYASAMAVARAKGGQRAFISPRPSEGGKDGWLIEAVGPEGAARIGTALCPAKGGMFFDIPMGRWDRVFLLSHVKRMSLAGIPRMQIAGDLGVHYQTVQRCRRELRELGHLPPSRSCASQATSTKPGSGKP